MSKTKNGKATAAKVAEAVRTTMRYVNPNDENRRKAVNALVALFEDPRNSSQSDNAMAQQADPRRVEYPASEMTN